MPLNSTMTHVGFMEWFEVKLAELTAQQNYTNIENVRENGIIGARPERTSAQSRRFDNNDKQQILKHTRHPFITTIASAALETIIAGLLCFFCFKIFHFHLRRQVFINTTNSNFNSKHIFSFFNFYFSFSRKFN